MTSLQYSMGGDADCEFFNWRKWYLQIEPVKWTNEMNLSRKKERIRIPNWAF